MKDLNDLLSQTKSKRRYAPVRYFGLSKENYSALSIAEDVLNMVSGIAPKEVTDALCRWIQQEGGPQ